MQNPLSLNAGHAFTLSLQSAFGDFFGDFSVVFGALGDFGVVFGAFGDFSVVFGAFKDFGVVLGASYTGRCPE